MATANSLNIRNVAARVVKDPTDLSAAFPYGGTELGLTMKNRFAPNIVTRETTREEWGGAAASAHYMSERGLLAMTLRDFDPDMVAAVFPNTASVNGHRVVRGSFASSVNLPGYDLAGLAAKILLAPLDPDAFEGVLLFNAVPVIDEDFSAEYGIGNEVGIGLSWLAMPDSTGRTWEMGKIAGMTL